MAYWSDSRVNASLVPKSTPSHSILAFIEMHLVAIFSIFVFASCFQVSVAVVNKNPAVEVQECKVCVDTTGKPCELIGDRLQLLKAGIGANAISSYYTDALSTTDAAFTVEISKHDSTTLEFTLQNLKTNLDGVALNDITQKTRYRMILFGADTSRFVQVFDLAGYEKCSYKISNPPLVVGKLVSNWVVGNLIP